MWPALSASAQLNCPTLFDALVWLQGYGFVRVFRFAAPDGGTKGAEYWANSDPDLTETQRAPLAALAWGIEQYHRGLKQCCGV